MPWQTKKPDLKNDPRYLEPKVNDLSSQLAQKASQLYVDEKFSFIGNASPKGAYATLTALQTAFPTGNANIYVVTADGKWYYWNGSAWTAGGTYQSTTFADQSITPSKLAKTNIVDMLNRATVTDGAYLDTATATLGQVKTTSGVSYSDYIPMTSGKQYSAFVGDNYGGVLGHAAVFYDSAKTAIGAIIGSGTATSLRLVATTPDFTFTAPANVAFVRLNLTNAKTASWYFKPTDNSLVNLDWLQVKTPNYEDESITLTKLSQEVKDAMNQPITVPETVTSWAGKTGNFLGDSNTAGYGLTTPTTERFSSLIATDLGMTCNNYGVSGTKITKLSDGDNSFTQRYLAMVNADIVFVLGGTNDYAHTTAYGVAPFGTFADRMDTTFYGALHVLYKGLVEKYVGKQIVVMTPLHMKAPNGISGDDYVVHPDTGKNLRDYVNAIKEVAQYYGLPVLDLFSEIPIRPSIPILKSTYMPDDVHINAAGHRMVADKIISFMKQL